MWIYNEAKKQWTNRYSAKTKGVIELKGDSFVHYFITINEFGQGNASLGGFEINEETAKQVCDREWEDMVQAQKDCNYIENALEMLEE